MNFKKINNITGWLVFATAFIVYLMTMERTVSFWDCGEFLSTAYKLEVGHSPGAPLFMIMGRLFAILAPNRETVALMVNSMSALMSALTILLLFWSITHFARKFFSSQRYGEDMSKGNLIAVMGAGIVGALAYTFSDTFWFSAVEAEVYATSSFFTAFVFWAILKWEDSCNEPGADRWLILIAYMIGLSVGVHLLSLLVIPTIALIYYFKRYDVKTSGAVIAFMIGCVILALVQYGVIQYIPIFASWFELLFVNSFGMPLNSGALFFLLLFAAILGYLLVWSRKKARYIIHLAVLCLSFVSIGYVFSYIPTLIRAQAGVSINMTNPDNVMALIPYLQREQFGATPFLYGQDFDSRTSLSDAEPKSVYLPAKKDGKAYYEEVGIKKEYVFDKERFFPRIWNNNDAGHEQFYRNFLGLGPNDEPSAADNYKFFLNYQVNWMFWRYFMWNYTGRQNDIEGQGESINGNWISGITPIDKALGKGDINKLSRGYTENKARNQMYFLPFILGIVGLFYQFKRNKLDGYIVLSLFFFTGLAVQLYINNTPLQPRERDYQYVAAYPFAMWIGFGVLACRDWLEKVVKNSQTAALASTAICFVAVPVLMASQEWNDHDRSLKTLARDHAYNVLSSCDSNAILLTYGDNDTYPLWYLQEVEGYRTDIRIINYNLLGTDWQNMELFSKINDADAIPMIWSKDDMRGDNMEVTPYVEDPRVPKNQFFTLEDVIRFAIDPKNRVRGMDGRALPYIPTKNFSQPLDKEALIKNGVVKASDSAYIPDAMQIVLDKNAAYRADMALMNIVAGVAKDGWRRPIYFTDGTPNLGLSAYFQNQGMINKLVPIQNPNAVSGLPTFTDLDKNIELLTKTYTYGLANTDKVYYDEKNRVMFISYLLTASELANNLSIHGRKEDAIKVLDDIMKRISRSSYPYEMVAGYDRGTLPAIIDAYYRAGAPEKAREYANIMSDNLQRFSNYFFDLSKNSQNATMQMMHFNLMSFYRTVLSANANGDTENAKKWGEQLDALSIRAGLGSTEQRPQQAAPQPAPQPET